MQPSQFYNRHEQVDTLHCLLRNLSPDSLESGLEQVVCVKLRPHTNEFGETVYTIVSADSNFAKFVRSETPDLVGKSLETVFGEKFGQLKKILSKIDTKGETYGCEANILGDEIKYRIHVAICERNEIQLNICTLVNFDANKFFQKLVLAQAIVDALPNYMYVYDLQFQQNIFASGGLSVILGYSQEEVKAFGSQLFTKLLHPDDVDIVAQHQLELASLPDGVVRKVEYRFRAKSGGWLYLESSDVPFKRNEDGTIIQIMGVVIDISKQKAVELTLAETDLKLTNQNLELHKLNIELKQLNSELIFAKSIVEESEERLKAIVNNSPSLNIITDTEGFVVYVSPQCKAVTGYSAKTFLGKKMPKLIHPQFRTKYRQLWQEVNRKKTTFTGVEYQILDPNGKWRWVSHSTKWIIIQGVEIGLLNTFSDISAQKIAHSELLNATRKAEENERLKSEFLASISHEIRTPLNGVLGFSELYLDQKTDEDKRKLYATIMRESSDQLLKIVTDILEISKIETQQLDYKESKFNVIHFIQEEFGRFQRLCNQKGLTFDFSSLYDLPSMYMHTDGVKLKQILLYLIDNAIKFTNTGGIRISWSQEANVTVFEVQDTGMGIDLEYREIIFDRFRQFSNQNGLNYGGTGLGLAIAKAYVQKLKGEIMLVSETGVGSTFYVRIPNLFTTQNLTMPEKKQTIKDCKVLIVEDDPNNYKYLRFILHRNGIHTLWAQTGAQGLHIMNEDDTVGLILMDIHLPDTNGYDLSKEIKLSHPNIPIVAQTAFAIGEEFENALSGLFFDYLSKPIDKESLLYMIKRINATYFV